MDNSFFSKEQARLRQLECMQRMAMGSLYGGGLGQQGFIGKATTNNSDSDNKLLLLENENETDTI